jgi:hypothetical protein
MNVFLMYWIDVGGWVMTGSKKKYILLSLGAFLLCGGVLTYALTDSNLRKHVDNPVTPGTIAIALQEQVGTEETMGDNTSPTFSNTLTWSKESDEKDAGYTAVKQVQVTNLNQTGENNAAAYVRVCILPRWVTTMEGTDIQVDVQCSAVGLSEIGTLNSVDVLTALSGTEAHTYILGDVTFTLDENWKKYWFFNSADGYFYYKTPLKPGESTTVLLSKVSISNDTYTKLLDSDSKETQVISLVVDVLSDSIQTEGGAVGQRWSNAGVQINSQTGALETVPETTAAETTTVVSGTTTTQAKQ